ncbi:MAG: hypothetical protein EBZ67_14685, partial [Chitinophagia bacterium]|nr:hypothetical protein [Chitinophagia bacterium]
MKQSRRRKWRSVAALALVASVWAVIYYTGDQDRKVAESGYFTIDTTDPDSLTKAASLATAETSVSFTIDTRDLDSVARALTLQTTEESGSFTIDTRDPDPEVFATSLAVAEYSPAFTIDFECDPSAPLPSGPVLPISLSDHPLADLSVRIKSPWACPVPNPAISLA